MSPENQYFQTEHSKQGSGCPKSLHLEIIASVSLEALDTFWGSSGRPERDGYDPSFLETSCLWRYEVSFFTWFILRSTFNDFRILFSLRKYSKTLHLSATNPSLHTYSGCLLNKYLCHTSFLPHKSTLFERPFTCQALLLLSHSPSRTVSFIKATIRALSQSTRRMRKC